MCDSCVLCDCVGDHPICCKQHQLRCLWQGRLDEVRSLFSFGSFGQCTESHRQTTNDWRQIKWLLLMLFLMFLPFFLAFSLLSILSLPSRSLLSSLLLRTFQTMTPGWSTMWMQTTALQWRGISSRGPAMLSRHGIGTKGSTVDKLAFFDLLFTAAVKISGASQSDLLPVVALYWPSSRLFKAVLNRSSVRLPSGTPTILFFF